MRRILIDSGILLSYYQQQEPLHQAVVSFFDQTAAQLITSPICTAEVLWLLGNPGDPRVLSAQNHLLGAVSRGGIEAINLLRRITPALRNSITAMPIYPAILPISPW